MALAESMTAALKEWAVVCDNLLEGKQVVMLRKGGIRETGGEFELEHPRFFLFPTYVHQEAHLLKEPFGEKIEKVTSEPDEIVIRAAAEVTDIVPIVKRGQLQAIDEQHPWSEALIDMRFNYRPENPLYLLLLRVYRLAEPRRIINTPAYAGCRSWVALSPPVSTGGTTPVLSDALYQDRRQRIAKSIELARG